MRLLLFCILHCVFAAAAAAQFSPCLIDTAPAPQLIPWQYYPGMPPVMIPDPNRRPRWEPREAFIEPAVRINPLGWYRWEFLMPAAGRCMRAFDSVVEPNAAAELTKQIIGEYTGIPLTALMGKPTGDVEVIVMTAYEFDAWSRGRSTTTRGGSRGKQTGGRFEVDLQPGWHVVVISNAHSGFYSKTVGFMFGGKPPRHLRP